MVSGVGFKNTATEDHGGAPRKKMVSQGLIITFMIFLVIAGITGGLYLWKNNLKAQATQLDAEIARVNTATSDALEEVAEFAVRSQALEDQIYRGYDTNDILREIENIMIPRIVLKSFQHNASSYERTTNKNVQTKGSITISADADTFDVMAQQIEVFKKSPYFSDVKVGTTDRDDLGRIIFTLSMHVNDSEETSYDPVNSASTDAMPMVDVAVPAAETQEPVVEVTSTDAEAQVTVTDQE